MIEAIVIRPNVVIRNYHFSYSTLVTVQATRMMCTWITVIIHSISVLATPSSIDLPASSAFPYHAPCTPPLFIHFSPSSCLCHVCLVYFIPHFVSAPHPSYQAVFPFFCCLVASGE